MMEAPSHPPPIGTLPHFLFPVTLPLASGGDTAQGYWSGVDPGGGRTILRLSLARVEKSGSLYSPDRQPKAKGGVLGPPSLRQEVGQARTVYLSPGQLTAQTARRRPRKAAFCNPTA